MYLQLLLLFINSNSHCDINAAFVPGRLCSEKMHMEGSTALHMVLAGKVYRPLCVQALVDNGAALDVTDTYGRTPLHFASMSGHYRLMTLLAPTPESFCLKDYDGCTPLYYACKGTHLECVKEFIHKIPHIICDMMKVVNKYGATPLSVRADDDQTILHIACKNGNLSVVKKVLEAGADPNVTDKFGCTPLFYACKNSHVECVREFMVQTPNVCDFIKLMKVANKIGATPLSVRGYNDQTILHVACKKGDLSIVKKVLEAGAYPNVTDRFGCTPLYYACKNFHIECIREFMVQIPNVVCDLMKVANKIGATPLSIRGDNGQTILHVACKKGDLSIVKKVLKAGADPNVTDRFGCTPLYYACKKGDLSIVKKVLKAGADPNVTDRFGCTPLYYACKKGELSIVKKVLEAGADPNVKDKFGFHTTYVKYQKISHQ